MTTTSTTALRRPPLPFTKMHGLGNDFLVLDATRQPIALSPEDIRALADRHFGVGFDQLLVVTPGPSADVDFATASLTPTVPRWSNAATVPAALPASSTTRD